MVSNRIAYNSRRSKPGKGIVVDMVNECGIGIRYVSWSRYYRDKHIMRHSVD